MDAISTYNLTKKYKSFAAVNEMSLSIPEGSIYGFLGPNGAGKTTTIKMLTGLIKPTSGRIKILGKDIVFGKTDVFSSIGYLPDVPHYYNWMNAEDFLKFTGDIFHMDHKVLMSKIPKLLDLVGLVNETKKVSKYSRGMKQRLGIAQALINDPKVIFLDEPSSALDPIGRRDVLTIIKKLAGKVTVFFSTHILSDAEEVCDRILILNKGVKVLEDSVTNIKSNIKPDGILIELNGKNHHAIMIDKLMAEPYVKEALFAEDKLKVSVYDIKSAQLNIPRLISDNNFYLKSFELIQPNLEDIFLKVVQENE